jgi:hypothetical protein
MRLILPAFFSVGSHLPLALPKVTEAPCPRAGAGRIFLQVLLAAKIDAGGLGSRLRQPAG